MRLRSSWLGPRTYTAGRHIKHNAQTEVIQRSSQLHALRELRASCVMCIRVHLCVWYSSALRPCQKAMEPYAMGQATCHRRY
jgi:hypothetical protein